MNAQKKLSDTARRLAHPMESVVIVFINALLIAVLLSATTRAADESTDDAETLGTSSVGMPVRVDQIVLPGTELEVAREPGDDAPIRLRIVAVYPHGSDFRYDLEYFGLDPGRFDLGEYLRRKDGTPTDDLPELSVVVTAVRPPGQIEPNLPVPHGSPRMGGYRLLLIAGAVVWVAGLVVLLVAGRTRRRRHESLARPVTLEDRLRTAAAKAIDQGLEPGDHAELERMLLAYWQKRLGLERTKPAEALRRLREHDEAGPVLAQLELWLHHPTADVEVDLAQLLEPYRDLRTEEPAAVPQTAGADHD